MSRNWEDLGIRWEQETVRHQAGDHATDKVELGQAQIAVVEDLDKFRRAVGDDVILGILDGTSIRVATQDTGRRVLKQGIKSVDAMREAAWNRIVGNRASGPRVREVKVYPLPGGGKWSGTDVVEYQQSYLAALVDNGVPVDAAKAVVSTLAL